MNSCSSTHSFSKIRINDGCLVWMRGKELCLCGTNDAEQKQPWQRGRCSLGAIIFIVTSLACTGFIFDPRRQQSQLNLYRLDDGRRLTEIIPKVESKFQHVVHLRPWIDPPTPKLTGKVWNATNIQWYENSFRFSSHSRDAQFYLYTPHQIQKAFRHHSILLQGDSTFRRLYGTLHGVLNYDVWTGSTTHFPKGFPSQVPNPPFGIPATYFVRRGLNVPREGIDQEELLALLIHSPSPIDPRILDHRAIIDVNKEFHTEPCHRMFSPARNQLDDLNENINRTGSAIISKSSQFENNVCRPHPSGGWLPPSTVDVPISHQQHSPTLNPLLYDYININCLGKIYDFVTDELLTLQPVTSQYSMYIVGPGVWETVKQTACHHPLIEKLHSKQVKWPDTLYQLLQMTLENLARLADQSPDLLIVWRTSGYYDGDERSYIIKEMNKQATSYINDWNKNHTDRSGNNHSNFNSIDFGSAIEHRSHGKQRLRGDMQAHYGLEARILQLQMITNLLYEYSYVK